MTRRPNFGPTDKVVTYDRIVRLYQDGLTYADITTELGVYRDMILQALKHHGIQTRHAGPAHKLVQCEIDCVLKMVREGRLRKEIADEFGVNEGTITAIINMNGGRRFLMRNHKESTQ